GRREGGLVMIERQEAPRRPDPAEKRARVAAVAERQVGDDVAGARIERLEHLVHEDRDVRAGGRSALRPDVIPDLGESGGVLLLVAFLKRPRVCTRVAATALGTRALIGR